MADPIGGAEAQVRARAPLQIEIDRPAREFSLLICYKLSLEMCAQHNWPEMDATTALVYGVRHCAALAHTPSAKMQCAAMSESSHLVSKSIMATDEWSECSLSSIQVCSPRRRTMLAHANNISAS